MIIQCPECQTRFKVADEKVKPGGIKVRCAKCRHIFAAQPEPEDPPASPQAEPSPEEGAWAQHAEAPGAASIPQQFDEPAVPAAEPSLPPLQQAVDADSLKLEPTETRSEEEGFDGFEEFSLPQEPVAPNAADSAAPEEEPEGEFDFGEPPLSGGQDAGLAFETEPAEEDTAFSFEIEQSGQAEDFSFDDNEEELAFEDESAFDTSGESVPMENEPSGEPGEFDLPAAKDFEAEDAFSFAEEGAETSADEFGVDEFAFEEPAGTSLDEPEDVFAENAEPFAFEEPAAESSELDWEEEPAQEPDTLSGPGDEFDFGDSEAAPSKAEEFDFSGMTFGDEEPPEPVRVEPPHTDDDFDSLSLDLDQPAAASTAVAAAAAAPAPPAEPELGSEAGEEAPLPAPKRRKSPLSGLTVFLLALLAALLGAAGYFIWSEGSPEQALQRLTGTQGPVQPAGQIRLSGLSSFFINSDTEGQLFVISGNATNDFPEARSAIAVKGVLYDKSGKALVQQTVFCGNPLSEEALKTMRFAEIEERMNNQFGDTLSNLNVGPGKAIPFTIVFKSLPPDLAEFVVEVADSKPASK